MQKYKYKAVNLQKKSFTGTFIAEDEKDLAIQLARQNLFLISATSYNDKSPSAFFTIGTGKVKLSELNAFSRQFAIMINAGISILGCIDNLRNQPYSGYFRKILNMVYEDVRGGVVLSQALKKHDAVFPNFFLSMIYVGEVSGKLDMVLNSLADYYETDAAIKRRAKSAAAYPIMLVVMTIGIVVLMLLFVVPSFRDSLSSLEIAPSGLTAAVYAVSDYMLATWQYYLVAIIILASGIFIFSKTKKGKYVMSVVKLRMPIVGNITMNMIMARFARGFGLLLSSGMDIMEAMEVICNVLGNIDVEERFKKATEDVRHGMSLTVAMESYRIFPDMMLQMISVGEKTAALDSVLNRSCKFFDEKVETSLVSLTNKIQPIMLLTMGGVIGTLFVAIYSPMLSIMQGL